MALAGATADAAVCAEASVAGPEAAGAGGATATDPLAAARC